jgi:hypothetical protein
MAATSIGEDTPLLASSRKARSTETRCTCFTITVVVMLSGIPVVLMVMAKNINNNRLHRTSFEGNQVNKSRNNQSSFVFPENFIWGAATSAYQIEGGASVGGRGISIWDKFCLESPDNCNGDTGNITDDHFHHWQEDIDLMHSLGLKAYRFSISWSRILPTGIAEGNESGDYRYSETKGINYDGVQFYNRIINSLIAKGIEPFITLYHWDLPQSLQDKYKGWEGEQIIEDFAKVKDFYSIQQVHRHNLTFFVHSMPEYASSSLVTE